MRASIQDEVPPRPDLHQSRRAGRLRHRYGQRSRRALHQQALEPLPLQRYHRFDNLAEAPLPNLLSSMLLAEELGVNALPLHPQPRR